VVLVHASSRAVAEGHARDLHRSVQTVGDGILKTQRRKGAEFRISRVGIFQESLRLCGLCVEIKRRHEGEAFRFLGDADFAMTIGLSTALHMS